MRKRLAALLAAITFTVSLAEISVGKTTYAKKALNNEQLTEEQKVEDFEYMYNVLKDNYPYFEVEKRVDGIDWLANKDEYISLIKKTKDDESYYNILSGILGDLNNGHSDILNGSGYKSYINMYGQAAKKNPGYKVWVDELENQKSEERYGYTADSEENGKRENLRNAASSDNMETKLFKSKKVGYLAIHQFDYYDIEAFSKQIHAYLSSIKKYKGLIIDIRGNGGGTDEDWITMLRMLINKPISDTEYVAFRGGAFEDKFMRGILGNDDNSLQSTQNIDTKKLNKLPAEVKKDFKYYLSINKSFSPKDSVGFRGKIYLLVDSGVFSSSESFAVFAKSTGFATLVGERTGGDGIGVDPALCALKNSGYVFRFPMDMGLTSDGTCNFEYKTKPDIKVSAKVNKDLNKDKAVQTVLKLVH
ncbi:S41 family peptidase [Clostridium oryzae]|uniref:Carboxy-terminal protease n=1 Tax=Clostridium oryzae TaxID=1450648 RepID=A0A1V4IYB4_9CLOT|nr:S41 family peptidase [Clostridium oryzae]OPJ64775.1 carboxy-terminal protease [Clostridium oryzae]